MNFGMNQLIGAVVNMVERNPQLMQSIEGSPNRKAMYEALKTGDAVRGQELADNYCKSNNMTREQMVNHATDFFSKNNNF